MNSPNLLLHPTPSFFSLSLRPQLFLWTIRHLVYAVRWNRSVCSHVQKTFELAQIPELPALIDDLLYSIAQHATRTIEVATPQCKYLLDDERKLVDCLCLFQRKPEACGCRYFIDMIDPGGLDSVMPRVMTIAGLMANCQRMAPLFCSQGTEFNEDHNLTIH